MIVSIDIASFIRNVAPRAADAVLSAFVFMHTHTHHTGMTTSSYDRESGQVRQR